MRGETVSQRPDPLGDVPPLARLESIADDAWRTAGYIEDFIARFRGHEPTANGTALNAVPSGHVGQLERLTDALHRVDCLARELQTIG